MNALIIIDMQNGCFAGEPARHDRAGLVERIGRLAGAVRADGVVVHIQHTDSDEGFARGSEPWKFIPEMSVEPTDLVVEKSGCDAFLESGLAELLRRRGVSEVIVVGCATDFCVDTTVRSAGAHGFGVTAVSDGHTTRDRPHLCAVDIITHHNYVWQDFLLPKGKRVRVVATNRLLEEMTSTEAPP